MHKRFPPNRGPALRRVVVVGSSGAGKSTFARRLGALTGLPVVHLDRHFWQPGWVQMEREAWRAEHRRLVEAPRWIMDGTYGGTLAERLARADTAIFLDLPRRIALSRVLRRTVAGYGRTRAEMPEGCPERFDWEFLRYVWSYSRRIRPGVLDALEAFGGRAVILGRPAEVEAWLTVMAGTPDE